MALQNPWIGYIERTYQQAKAAVLLKIRGNAPEITDHSENEIFVKTVSIWCGLHEQLGAYVDFYGKQVFLSQTDLYRYAVMIARGFDYRIQGYVGASVTVRFTINAPAPSDITIPQGTIVRTALGIEYVTQAPGTILTGGTTVDISVRQEKAMGPTVIGVSDGTPDQVFIIPGNVIDQTVQVTINAVVWETSETLAFSVAASNHFVQSINEDGDTIITFGDGVSGAIPTTGQDVNITYKVSEAESGNVAPSMINEIVSVLTLPPGITATVLNPERATGGSTYETLEQLKKRIPASNRTKNRAVSTQDYIDVAELATGVEKARVDYHCGKVVGVYIVPTGGGLAGPALIASAQIWMDTNKMITTKVTVYAAGEVGMYYDITVTALPNFINSEVDAAVRAALLAFHDSGNQEIAGSVQLSDIYFVIENTRGVRHSKINTMRTVPYARPTEGASTLNWTRTVKSTSVATVQWVIQFISAGSFQLFKDGTYMGSFVTGSGLSFTEIDFTVNGAYTIGDSFEFYTYGTVQLVEQSIPALDTGNLVTNTIGGVQ